MIDWLFVCSIEWLIDWPHSAELSLTTQLWYRVIQNLRPPSGAASERLSVNLTRVGWNIFSLNIICQISWSRSLWIGLHNFLSKKSERVHFSRIRAFFTKIEVLLDNCLYVLDVFLRSENDQNKSKPIFERRMIALQDKIKN